MAGSPDGVLHCESEVPPRSGRCKADDGVSEAVSLSMPQKDQQREVHSMNVGSYIVISSSLESVCHIFTPLLPKNLPQQKIFQKEDVYFR